MFFNLTTKTIMKKIILASLLFSLATLVNATPSTITLTANIIDENLDIGTTIGTATASGGTAPYSYDVQDEGNTSSFGVMLTQISPNATDDGVNNFKVRPAGGNNDGSNDITIATINFNSSASAENPATKLAAAINAYNAANNSGVSATGMNASGTNASGTVRLDSWPANLDGATLIGFSVEADGAYISINSGLTISTPPTSDFFSIDAATGVLKSKVEFDYEAKGSYTIVIRATDNTGGYLENFIIYIGDLDDVATPIDITLLPNTVAENNAAGTTVGNLATLATLGGTGPYTYSIAAKKNFTFTVEGINNNNPAFGTFEAVELGGTITIVANTFYGYELYSISIANLVANEINGGTSFSSFTAIAVDDTTVRLTGWSDKYDGGQFIGPSSTASGSATPVDYIKTTYDDATLPIPDYNYFSIEGDKLITTAVLDKATQGSYTITINSTDKNNTVISKDFTITVVDGPSGTVTGITLAPNTINNQAADGATVGLLSTNATDTGRVYVLENNTATFSISDDKLTANNPGSFTIVGATYTVYVSTLNGDNTIFTQSLTITVTEEAEKTFSLDVDGNNSLAAPNDGLIIFKYLLNSNANNLHTTIASDTPDGRKTTPQLKAYLDDAGTILDVDGNGTINAPNDGLIIFKYLLNSNANNLHTTIASDAPDGKKTTPQLKAYLDLYSK